MTRTWSFDNSDVVRRTGDLMWRFSIEENGATRFVDVANPRMEADGDEDGIWYAPTFDSFTIDGREPTAFECDDLSDELRDEIRAQYNIT